MTIYLDLLFILNFVIDFLLLLTVHSVLKRKTSLKRIFFGAFIGGGSILFLFLPLTSLTLFFFKVLISFFMSLVTFKYVSLKYTINNLAYLYMISTILGGFIYLLNLQFSYRNDGLVFYFQGLSINVVLIFLLSPLILFLYLKQSKRLKANYNLYYEIEIVFSNQSHLKLTSFLDTGNKLIDPITNKPIILIDKQCLKGKIPIRSPIYVPIKTINKQSLLKCIKPKYIVINQNIYHNYLIGISEEKINIEGVSCILNNKLLEELPC